MRGGGREGGRVLTGICCLPGRSPLREGLTAGSILPARRRWHRCNPVQEGGREEGREGEKEGGREGGGEGAKHE